MMQFPHQTDHTWTLFLDRDGVINVEKNQDYIRHAGEFVFYENAKEAIVRFNQHFGRIIVVTNQRGIGKGLMTHDDLKGIHDHMMQEVHQAGGRIDRCYYAPSLFDDDADRKPNTGMGLKAKLDFPEIDFSKSVMIGNNLSDMAFGKNLGMMTIYLNTTHPIAGEHEWIDFSCSDLFEASHLF
ncbi:MAG: HAD-IIIA family hydrolase [Chitinophagaceae bacterium]|nr:HAD-IIIA family hydrolase [Chitinophagaceae bacterium]